MAPRRNRSQRLAEVDTLKKSSRSQMIGSVIDVEAERTVHGDRAEVSRKCFAVNKVAADTRGKRETLLGEPGANSLSEVT